jgi:polar amino acid transport system substrate-binding protein
MSRRLIAGCFALLLLLSPACVPSEVDDDSIPRFDPQTTLAGKIQREGTLVIGIEEDFPPFGSSEGEPRGFTVELGRWLADGLGVDAELVTGTSSELAEMVSSNEVDVAFPMVPITQAALDDHLFSDPYFDAHQRVLVPAGSGISTLADLAGKRVCSFADQTGVRIDELDPDIAVLPVNEARDCLRMLDSGAADAVTGADLLLISLVARSSEEMEIVGDDLSTAGYGAMVRRSPLGLNTFIDSVFGEAEDEGRWGDLYQEWVAPYAGNGSVEPPELTLETAAALNPS